MRVSEKITTNESRISLYRSWCALVQCKPYKYMIEWHGDSEIGVWPVLFRWSDQKKVFLEFDRMPVWNSDGADF